MTRSDAYRRDIDGLRAIAVLSVVIFHAFPTALPGGFVGVDVFFVISGFLISGLIFAQLAQEKFSFAQFYARRIRRIFPALAVVMIFTLGLGWLILFPDEFRQLGKHAFYSAIFVINFAFWREAGYFDTSAIFKPLLHLWSLAIEEQFYVTYPLLIWLAYKRSLIPAVLLICMIVSFCLNAALVHNHPAATFYLPFTRIWELLAGSTLAWSATYRLNQKSAIADVFTRHAAVLTHGAGICGLLLIVLAVAIIDAGEFPGWWALLPVTGSIMLLAAGERSYANRKFLARSPLVWIGLISYPLYLWHWVLLSFGRIIVAGELASETRLGLVAVSFALAWLTYILIERPIRFGAAPIAKTATLCASLACIAAFGIFVFRDGGVPSRLKAGYLKSTPQPGQTTSLNCPAEMASYGLTYCELAGNGPATAVVWGDSHAERVFAGLSREDQNRNWLLLGSFSCPPVIGIEVETDAQDCPERNKLILDFLARHSEIKIVMLAFFGNYIAADNFAADHVTNNAGPAQTTMRADGYEGRSKSDIFLFGLEAAAKALAGKSIVIFVDVPELPFFPRRCVARPLLGEINDCTVPRAIVDKRQREFRAVLSRLKTADPKINVFDPIDLFCNRESCSPMRDGELLYDDSHHMSVMASGLVAARFLRSFDALQAHY